LKVTIIEPDIKIKQKKKRACAYARVSTDNHKQGESLENQIEYYKTMISTNPEYEFVDIFADKGLTGTTENRPEFQRMLDFCRNGEIDLIYTKSISRFARNTVIVIQIVRELKALGIEVIFEKENIRTLKGDGEVMLTILSSVAEEESRSISENIKWRFKKKFEGGKLIINTNRFLGYDKDEQGDLVINLYESMIVKRIFDEYLKGNGAFKIAKMLNSENMPTVTGTKWCESTIFTMLRNEKYKGDVIQQKTYTLDHLTKKKKINNGKMDTYYIEGNHPPIIPKEVWEQAQIEIKRHSKEKCNIKGDDKYKNRYPLTGMLFCSKCGSVLKRRIWNSKLSCRKVVWQCSNYIKNGKDSCSGFSIEDSIISNVEINKPTIIEEEFIDGKKHYSYTSK